MMNNPHPAPSPEHQQRLHEKVLAEAIRLEAENARAVIGYYIVAAAAEFFKFCPDDFGIQHINDGVIIFGGTNRLIWTPHGFRPDPPYCSPRFLEQFGLKKP
jgi:hypothetical protein